MRETTRDVEVNQCKYRLSKMPPMVASWIKNVLLKTMVMSMSGIQQPQAPGPSAASTESDAEDTVGSMWLLAGSMESSTYSQIQSACLKTIAAYVADSPAPVPVMMADGRWADRDLEQDAVSVDVLILHALKFNIAPFFAEAASKVQSSTSA